MAARPATYPRKRWRRCRSPAATSSASRCSSRRSRWLSRGSVSLSGQRGVNTGFTIDGASAKSAFFGFGRGGLAREGAATSWPRSRSGSFRVAQQILGVYAQDSWRPNPRLTLHYGARWDATFNPAGIENMLPAGRSIPDDRDNFSPRGGFVWSLDAKSLLRGGGGLFYTRTPSPLFSTAHTDTGIYPRFGSAIVTPGETASSRSATRSTTRTRPPA